MTLGKWMRQVRREKNLTMEECAQRANVKQPTWAGWESEGGERRQSTLKKIAYALDVSEEEVFKAAGFPIVPEAQLSSLLRDLSPEEQRIVLNVAKATRDSLRMRDLVTA